MRIAEGLPLSARIDGRQGVDSAEGSTIPAPLAPPARPEVSHYSGGHDLMQIVSSANATEDVRPGVVDEVSRRLAAGVFETRTSAEQTAEAILRSAN
jgi:hypothetical protein